MLLRRLVQRVAHLDELLLLLRHLGRVALLVAECEVGAVVAALLEVEAKPLLLTWLVLDTGLLLDVDDADVVVGRLRCWLRLVDLAVVQSTDRRVGVDVWRLWLHWAKVVRRQHGFIRQLCLVRQGLVGHVHASVTERRVRH